MPLDSGHNGLSELRSTAMIALTLFTRLGRAPDMDTRNSSATLRQTGLARVWASFSHQRGWHPGAIDLVIKGFTYEGWGWN